MSYAMNKLTLALTLWLAGSSGLKAQALPEQVSELPLKRSHALGPEQQLWGAIDGDTQQLHLWRQTPAARSPADAQLVWQGEVTTRVVEDICFYQSEQNGQLSVFLLGGRGGAEQWLLRQDHHWLSTPMVLREFSVPYDATACALHENQLLIAEGDQAIWAYHAEPEADQGRDLIAAKYPFGAIKGELKALEVLADGRLLALEEAPPRLLEYRVTETGYQLTQTYPIDKFEELQDIRVLANGKLLVSNEDTGASTQLSLTKPAQAQPPRATKAQIAQVAAGLQTTPASRRGDAIDDPAVWVHPQQPQLSRIVATDKRVGLMVYDMQGQLVQELLVGRLNNVDLRGQLAAASLRNDNSIQLFDISDDGEFSVATNIATDLNEIYGLCMGYNSADNTTSVYVNSKSGRIQHYQVQPHQQGWRASLVRTMQVPTQPEGCVVDDQTQRLFVGEEDHAVWLFDAAATAGTTGQRIIQVDQHPELVDDIEGLAFTYHDGQPLLFVSSQGNDSYLVFEGQAPWRMLSQFRIRANVELGIDGASETDGIEVTSLSLGEGFKEGAFLVQDGRNWQPEAGQNLKLVPLQEILKLVTQP